MRCFFSLLLVILSSPGVSFSQQFIYTDKEIHYDEIADQVRILSVPGELLHAWKFGRSGVTLNLYNNDLHYISTKKIASRYKNISFIRYSNFYYAILSDSTDTEIYAVKNDGTYTEKTKEFEKQKLTLGVHHFYSFRQGKGIIFLLQQLNDAGNQKTFLHITALDTTLRFMNEMILEIEYLRGLPQQLQLLPLDDQLLLLNHTIRDGAESLAFTKIDPAGGSFVTSYFSPRGLEFLSHQLLFFGNEIILQSRVREGGQRDLRQKIFSYFIKLNQQLQVMNYLYLNSPQLTALQQSGYVYKTVLTTVLPNKQLLAIEYGVKENKKLIGAEDNLRFLWIDSSLGIVRSFEQPVEGQRQYYPGLLLAKGENLHIYYEEMVRNKVKIINTYELKDSIVNDRALLLTSTNWYLLRDAVPVGESSFVMP
ncbi:MAG: hypothetical protein ABI688_07890, partial [Bacteroidota bacterium]